MPRPSPTVRRRRLASLMRNFREEARKSREEAARHAGIAPITISRIETARHGPKAADILTLARFYGLDDERAEALATLARESRVKGWWQRYGTAIPDWFEVYVGLEEEVSELRSYQVSVILGLLQTERYMRALIADESGVSPEEADCRVALRLERQDRLTRHDGLRLWLVLDESSLRRIVGGPEVMREQFEHLLAMTSLPQVMVQVLPFAAGAHPGMDGAFDILTFPDPADAEVVYLQYRMGSVYLEESRFIREYAGLFDRLRAKALDPDDSRALIEQIAGTLR